MTEQKILTGILALCISMIHHGLAFAPFISLKWGSLMLVCGVLGGAPIAGHLFRKVKTEQH